MSRKVVANVERIIVQKPFSEARMELSFPSNLLYLIEVPEEFSEEVGGKITFVQKGIQHIMKDATVILYFETEETDF